MIEARSICGICLREKPLLETRDLRIGPERELTTVCLACADDEPAAYECPQCGPDPRGADAHAQDHMAGIPEWDEDNEDGELQ